MDVQHCHILVGAPADIIGFKKLRVFSIEKITMCVLDDTEKIYSTDLFQSQVLRPLVMHTSARFVMLSAIPFRPPVVPKWTYIQNLDAPNIKQHFLRVDDIAGKLQAIIFIYKILEKTKTKGIVFCQVSYRHWMNLNSILPTNNPKNNKIKQSKF